MGDEGDNEIKEMFYDSDIADNIFYSDTNIRIDVFISEINTIIKLKKFPKYLQLLAL